MMAIQLKNYQNLIARINYYSKKLKQMNLMLIDSIFPLILADVVLDTFLNKINSFYNYTKSKNKIIIYDSKFDSNYLELRVLFIT